MGVCSECGQGICNSCAVRIGGRLYCKSDADKVFGPAAEGAGSTALVVRPLRVTAGSILFAIYGVVGIGLSFIFIIGGFFIGGIANLYSPFYPAGEFASIGVILFGGILLVMGIFGLVCSWWLWRMDLWGAAIGIALLAMGMVFATIPALIAPTLSTGELAGVVWASNVSMIILLSFGWARISRGQSEEIV